MADEATTSAIFREPITGLEGEDGPRYPDIA